MAMGRGKAPSSAGAKRVVRSSVKSGSRPAAKAASGERVKKKPRQAARSASAGKRAGGSSDGAVALPALMPLDPAHLRHLMAEQPGLLEPTLRVHVDESGAEVGAQYDTDVGEIDLLGRDDQGDWVVVMVAESPSDQDIIQGTLHRIGWLRKHLLGSGESARGIILIERLDDELEYAAAAVADTIDFKTWRLSLAFDSLEA